MTRGFNPELNTFVQSYDSTALDASLLLIPRVGFLPADDSRVIGTIDAIQRDLTQDGFVLRYRSAGSDDGLPGGEGVFIACSFWLVNALQGAGRTDEAVALVERLLDLRNGRQVAGLLEGLAQRVVLVTHDLDLLRGWQRVLVIDQGRVVADGDAERSIGQYEALMAVGRPC